MTTLAGQLLLCDRQENARLAPGSVRIAAGRIAEVVVGKLPTDADIGNATTLISPGFIDAHLHLSQFDIIGAHGQPLLHWLRDVTFPAESAWSRSAKPSSPSALEQCLAVGTTGICAYATSDAQATIRALRQASKFGMRGVIGHVLMDRPLTAELCQPIDKLLRDSLQTLQQFPPGLPLSAAVTPRFAVSCTTELLAAAAELARQHQAVIQTHFAETQQECRHVQQLFGGKKYLDVYREAGLLGPRTILGHGIYLDKQDHRTLAELGCVIAHCPTANRFLRSGTMNRRALLEASVTIALGSDVGAGYERSMVRVARAMIEAAASIGDDFPSASEAWYQITAGNADALGWRDAGRLTVGARADLVVIQPEIEWLNSHVDPLAALMWSWDDRWLKHVYVQGEKRY